jgi:hypothetical protein
MEEPGSQGIEPLTPIGRDAFFAVATASATAASQHVEVDTLYCGIEYRLHDSLNKLNIHSHSPVIRR